MGLLPQTVSPVPEEPLPFKAHAPTHVLPSISLMLMLVAVILVLLDVLPVLDYSPLIALPVEMSPPMELQLLTTLNPMEANVPQVVPQVNSLVPQYPIPVRLAVLNVSLAQGQPPPVLETPVKTIFSSITTAASVHVPITPIPLTHSVSLNVPRGTKDQSELPPPVSSAPPHLAPTHSPLKQQWPTGEAATNTK